MGEPQHTASQPPIRRPRQSGGRNANQWGAARPPSSHPSRGCRAVGVGGHGMTVDGERMPRPERPFHSENATETAGRDSKLLAWSPARGGGSGASIFKLRCETKFVAIVTFSHTGGLPRGIFEPPVARELWRDVAANMLTVGRRVTEQRAASPTNDGGASLARDKPLCDRDRTASGQSSLSVRWARPLIWRESVLSK